MVLLLAVVLQLGDHSPFADVKRRASILCIFIDNIFKVRDSLGVQTLQKKKKSKPKTKTTITTDVLFYLFVSFPEMLNNFCSFILNLLELRH